MDLYTIPECGHIFHNQCLRTWCRYPEMDTNTCPFCRRIFNCRDLDGGPLTTNDLRTAGDAPDEVVTYYRDDEREDIINNHGRYPVGTILSFEPQSQLDMRTERLVLDEDGNRTTETIGGPFGLYDDNSDDSNSFNGGFLKTRTRKKNKRTRKKNKRTKNKRTKNKRTKRKI